jgi:hypothetical protein
VVTGEPNVEPYGLALEFEQTAVTLACARPTFWALVGHALDPGALVDESHRLVLRAARVIATETGRGPANRTIVLQRVRRWMAEGKLTQESFEGAVEALGALSLHDVSEEAIAAELVPIVRKRLQQDAVRAAIDEYGKAGDFVRTMEMLEGAKRLGSHDVSVGSRLGMDSFGNIAALRGASRMPTGIFELDVGLKGGMPRGRLGVAMAGTNVGKSMWLLGMGALAMKRGALVAYATMELPVEEAEARVIACLTGAPITAILEGSDAEAKALLAPMLPSLGTFVSKDFPADVTTVKDLASWVSQIEARERRAVDLLLVDYGDQLSDGGKASKDNHWLSARYAFEELRLFAKSRGIWAWTATAAKRQERAVRGKRLDADDIGESLGKAKVCDLLVSAWFEKDGNEQINFYVAKCRFERSRFGAGPFSTAFDLGRIIHGYGVTP